LNPGFSFIAVLTLALGIGSTTVVYSVVNAVLISPLPYEEPDRLALIWTDFGRDLPQNWVSGPEFVEMQEFTTLFEDISVVFPTTVALTGAGEPEQLRAGLASGNFFQTMKVDAAQGRLFEPEDDTPGTAHVAVISDGFWKRRFGGDSSVLARTIYTDGLPLTVIGILPADFAILHPDANFPSSVDVWIPMTSVLPAVFGTAEYNRLPRSSHFMRAFGRMKPDVTLAQAQADMSAVARQMQEKSPNYYDLVEGWGITVLSLHGDLVEDVSTTLIVLFVAVAFVLLISCVNVANLQLARAASREREVAVRAALGAGRLRTVRQLVTESVTLSAIGGIVGLLLALLLVQAVAALAPAKSST
jgi:predicted permease